MNIDADVTFEMLSDDNIISLKALDLVETYFLQQPKNFVVTHKNKSTIY
ncbi:23913_t:CDS:2 [Cetraspora pellucida]|uniref:23913_t:CDS:1 n=1 Tax=Cetraspora pellucida TaxID=1433469 RepID=A0A9N9B506_9GLOM|nr:23913_t:CDS:2 [Cetraspora pellucida]